MSGDNVIVGICGADGLCSLCAGEERTGTDGCGSYFRVATILDPFPVVEVTPAEIADDVEAIMRHSARLREAEEGRTDSGSYFCPTSGDVESSRRGGFDVCCDRPDLHRPATETSASGGAE